MNCGDCFFLEYVDGVGFCNYYEDDVLLDGLCEHFMNYRDTQNMLQNVLDIFSTNCCECDGWESNVDDFIRVYGRLL